MKNKNLSVVMQWELSFKLKIEKSKWNIGFNKYIDNKCITLCAFEELPDFNKTTFRVL